jgi:hypothetical protein
MTLDLPDQDVSIEIYDNFNKPGYSLTDYAELWITPYGLGEMAVSDTRDFSGGHLNLYAVPFQTSSDAGVNDHLKYMAVSSRTFPVPEDGTLVLSSDIRASTRGTVLRDLRSNHGAQRLGSVAHRNRLNLDKLLRPAKRCDAEQRAWRPVRAVDALVLIPRQNQVIA